MSTPSGVSLVRLREHLPALQVLGERCNNAAINVQLELGSMAWQYGEETHNEQLSAAMSAMTRSAAWRRGKDMCFVHRRLAEEHERRSAHLSHLQSCTVQESTIEVARNHFRKIPAGHKARFQRLNNAHEILNSATQRATARLTPGRV